MGGVGASALDVWLFSCAETPATKRRTPKHTMTIRLLDFIRCFYQKRLGVYRKMFVERRQASGTKPRRQRRIRFTILPCCFSFFQRRRFP